MEVSHTVNTSHQKQPTPFRNILPCVLSTLVCTFLSLLNMYTDVAQSIIHFQNHKRWYGHLTLYVVLVPALISSVYTAVLCYTNKGLIVLKVKFPYPKLVYFLCAILHGHLARLIVWMYGLYTEAIPYNLAKNMVLANRDVTFYLEVFLQSLPQMYLQLYIMVVIYGTYTWIGIVTLITSFAAVSWGVLLLFDSWKSKIFAFQLNLMWMVSRVVSLALFSSVARIALFLLLAVHFAFALPLWFYETGKYPCERQSPTTVNRHRSFIVTFVQDMFFAILYAVCNTATPMLSGYHLQLSVIFIVENLTCITCVYYYGDLRTDIKSRTAWTNTHFKDWRHGDIFFTLCVVFSILSFLQSLIVCSWKLTTQTNNTEFMRSNILKVVKDMRRRRNSQRVSSPPATPMRVSVVVEQ